MKTKKKQKVKISTVMKGGLHDILLKLAEKDIDELLLVNSKKRRAKKEKIRTLSYSSARVFTYASEYCGGGNDCSSTYDSDCTHFMCHCLKKGGVKVNQPVATCDSRLCIRVNELAAAFYNSVSEYSNVKQITSHAATRRGDFCFVPAWFGLRKGHVMLLSERATADGVFVYAHSNQRCGQFVPFDGAACTYYRIEDAS